MLVSILSNLVMEGGVVPPIPTTPHGGGTKELSHIEEDNLRRKKILDQDDEDIFIILTNWITTWTSKQNF